MDFNIEIEPRLAQDIAAQQPGLAPRCQYRFEFFQQITVFTAQIQKPLGTTQQSRAHGHAFKHQIRITIEQYAVFERARFAFIRIANDIACDSRGVSATRPLVGGGIPRPAASPQSGQFEFGQCRVRRRARAPP